ncbi:MAG: DUF4360 domain-containing protein [Pseudobacteriovorax sp.]|nr:DUF4360 domain-containing protein [Pseudobacteriovorax sp.]
MKTLFRATSALFYALMAAQGFAQISNVSSQGPGCPVGTVNAITSIDGEAVTFVYSDFFVEVDETNRRDRTFCELGFRLNVPQGKTVALFSVDHRGYIYMEEQVQARLNSKLTINNLNRERTIQLINRQVRGPLERDFILSRDLRPNRNRPCLQNRNLDITIDTTLSLRTRQGEAGFVTLDSSDASLEQELGLSFIDCNGPTFVSYCRIQARFGAQGQRLREVSVHGTAPRPRQARMRAQNRAQRRCNALETRRPGLKSCEFTCGQATEISNRRSR